MNPADVQNLILGFWFWWRARARVGFRLEQSRVWWRRSCTIIRIKSIEFRLSLSMLFRRSLKHTSSRCWRIIIRILSSKCLITSTYDPNISAFLPFPVGCIHDLSLITDDDLPEMTSPPGLPTIDGWATYSSVLDGGPLFVMRMNCVTGTWRSFSQNASLLWRTNYDHDRADGFSGSVLCLGRPTDKNVTAVLFQNFESPIRPWQDLTDHTTTVTDKWNPTFKGDFLLPEKIRNATIKTVPGHASKAFNSLAPWTKHVILWSEKRSLFKSTLELTRKGVISHT